MRYRVGQVDGQFVVNPSYDERLVSKLNITVVATKDGVVMIESGAAGVSEETVVDAIEFGHNEAKKICAAVDELVAKAGKKKRVVAPIEFDQEYFAALTGQSERPSEGRSGHQDPSQNRKLRTGQTD